MGLVLVFEGVSHPYKNNIVKFGYKSKIASQPKVQETLEKERAKAA